MNLRVEKLGFWLLFPSTQISEMGEDDLSIKIDRTREMETAREKRSARDFRMFAVKCRQQIKKWLVEVSVNCTVVKN